MAIPRIQRNHRRGAAAVEFAIVAPIFFLMVLVIIEFGRLIMVQQVITNASREGARRAVVEGATVTDVQTVVNDYMDAASLADAEITVTPNPSSVGFGQPVTVTIEIAYSDVSWLTAPMFLGDTDLSATSVMRRETIP